MENRLLSITMFMHVIKGHLHTRHFVRCRFVSITLCVRKSTLISIYIVLDSIFYMTLYSFFHMSLIILEERSLV